MYFFCWKYSTIIRISAGSHYIVLPNAYYAANLVLVDYFFKVCSVYIYIYKYTYSCIKKKVLTKILGQSLPDVAKCWSAFTYSRIYQAGRG